MVLIVLLSNRRKYEIPFQLEGEIVRAGELMFRYLEEGRDQNFADTLRELHKLVESEGIPVESMRHTDVVVPPIGTDPETLRKVLGIKLPEKSLQDTIP